jgi:hypothetical protein
VSWLFYVDWDRVGGSMPSGGVKKHTDDKWIQGAIKRPGGLHESLGIPEGEKIPETALEIKSGDSPRLKKQKTLAKTMRGFHHG